MSFIIKGLDMPKGEDICLTWRIRRKDLNAVHYQPIRKKDIIEIPTPHGRIIDEKEVSKIVNERTLGWGWEYASGYTVLKAIDDAPTILEEEE